MHVAEQKKTNVTDRRTTMILYKAFLCREYVLLVGGTVVKLLVLVNLSITTDIRIRLQGS
jgi:hypothetical protein